MANGYSMYHQAGGFYVGTIAWLTDGVVTVSRSFYLSNHCSYIFE